MKEKKIYWFTGQPGAGKTVLSLMLKTVLEQEYKEKIFHIDGDELRSLFNNQKYGREGREENIKRAQDIAKFILVQGHTVIVSLVAPYKELRENLKKDLGELLVEFYVHTTDIRGREHFHTDEYEQPTENFIDIDTTNVAPQISLNEIIKHI
jgi:adenylylsulfate kinase-like enzyme